MKHELLEVISKLQKEHSDTENRALSQVETIKEQKLQIKQISQLNDQLKKQLRLLESDKLKMESEIIPELNMKLHDSDDRLKKSTEHMINFEKQMDAKIKKYKLEIEK